MVRRTEDRVSFQPTSWSMCPKIYQRCEGNNEYTYIYIKYQYEAGISIFKYYLQGIHIKVNRCEKANIIGTEPYCISTHTQTDRNTNETNYIETKKRYLYNKIYFKELLHGV